MHHPTALTTALTTALLTACSFSPTTFQDVRDELGRSLVAAGATGEEVTCALDAYVASGADTDADLAAIQADDASGDALNEVAARVGAAGTACFSAETMAALDESAEPEDIRAGFIIGFMETGPAGMQEEQAGCVFDELIASGVEVTELSAAAPSPAVVEAMSGAFETCGVAALADANLDGLSDAEIRDQFATGFSSVVGVPVEGAYCVFDELTDAGFSAREIAGSTVSPEVEAAVPPAMTACDLP